MQVTAVVCACMLTCAIARTNFAAAAPLIAGQLSLTIPQLSRMHSAFLVGYLVGHVPMGILADRYGGARVLCVAAFGWAAATLAHGGVPLLGPGGQAPALLALRFAVGATTAAAVPSVAAAIAQGLPEARRAGAMSAAYGTRRSCAFAVSADLFRAAHIGMLLQAGSQHWRGAS